GQNPVLDEPLLSGAIGNNRGGDGPPNQARRHWEAALGAVRKGVGQAAGGDSGAIECRPSRSRPAAPCAHWVDPQDAAEPQEQREERPTVAGAGKAHSEARGAADARMGGIAGSDKGSIHSLAAVGLYAVLLREQYCTDPGG